MNTNNYVYHYFYKITNNLNNHFYYGVHNTNDLEDGYMGSGKRLQIAYEKYGIENFTKEILKFFDTALEAFEYEEEVVNESLVNDDECYNLKIGGKGGWLKTYNHSLYVDKDGNKYWLEISDPLIKEKELKSYCSDFVTTKDSAGKIFYVSIYDKRYISGELKHIWKGRKHSKETKEKISQSLKNINYNQGKNNLRYGTCWIYNDKESISIQKDDLEKYLSNGWKKGRRIYNIKKMCWINDGENNLKIDIVNLSEYLDKGWNKGRLMKKYGSRKNKCSSLLIG